MIEAMKARQTLKAAELQNGDIICFQAAETVGKEGKASDAVQESITQLTTRVIHADLDRSQPLDPNTRSNVEPIEDARLYYDFILHRREVRFAPHPLRNANADQLEAFTLELSSRLSYDLVAIKVAERLKVHPTHLRFWTVNAQSNNPKGSVKRTAGQTLQTILNPQYLSFQNASAQLNDALFYEILEMSLSELDTMKTLKVVWLSKGTTQEVRVPTKSLVLTNDL